MTPHHSSASAKPFFSILSLLPLLFLLCLSLSPISCQLSPGAGPARAVGFQLRLLLSDLQPNTTTAIINDVSAAINIPQPRLSLFNTTFLPASNTTQFQLSFASATWLNDTLTSDMARDNFTAFAADTNSALYAGSIMRYLVAGSVSEVSPPFFLQLLYSVDVRGRMMPVQTTQSECTDGDWSGSPSKCFGGAARRAAFVKNAKLNTYTNTLAIDVANYFYGTLFQTIDNAASIAQWQGSAGYDVMGLGTNDFFQGPSLLANYLNNLGANPQCVCTNLKYSGEPLLNNPPRIKPYLIQTIGGRAIGFVGSIFENLKQQSSPGPNVYVNSNTTEDNAIRIAIAQLKTERPDVNIIVLITTSSSRELWARTIDGLSLVVTDQIKSNVPMLSVTSDFGKQVLVVSIPFTSSGPTAYGGAMGQLQVQFDDQGNILNPKSTIVTLSSDYPDDPAIKSAVLAIYAQVKSLSNIVIGKTWFDVWGGNGNNVTDGCRWSECQTGDLISDAMLDYCKDCSIAHYNSGGLRASILTANLGAQNPDGSWNITRKNVLDILPFGNNIVTYQIRGNNLLDVVKQSLTSRGKGGFQQWAGLRLAFNPLQQTSDYTTQPVGFVGVLDTDPQSSGYGYYAPLDPARIYKIATNNFVLNGGDSFTMIPNTALSTNTFGPVVAEQVVSLISRQGGINVPSRDGVIKRCFNTTFTLIKVGTSGNVSWPTDPLCRMINSDGAEDITTICVSNTAFCQPGQQAYPGKYFNNSCRSCSGLGQCIPNFQTCICDGPVSSGLFKDIQMIQGQDCSIIRTQYVVDSGLQGFLFFMCAITIAVCVGCSIFFHIYRENTVVKRSARLFLQLCCLGGILGAISAIFTTMESTDSSCEISHWLGNMAFVLMFGSLFVKTWRIYAIFGNKRLRTVSITDYDLLMRLGLFVSLELILRIVEVSTYPVGQRAVVYGNNDGAQGCALTKTIKIAEPWQYYLKCGSDSYKTFDVVNWLYKAIVTLIGIVLAISIRGIEKNFNESKFLGIVIYHMTIFALVAKFLIAFVLKDNNPSATVAIETIFICYVIMFTMLGLTIPKWHVIRSGAATTTSKSQLTSNSSAGKSSDADESDKEKGVVNPQTFRSNWQRHQARLRTLSPADRNADIVEYLSQAQSFIDMLTALKGSSGSVAASSSRPTTSSSSVAGMASGTAARPVAPSAPRGNPAPPQQQQQQQPSPRTTSSASLISPASPSSKPAETNDVELEVITSPGTLSNTPPRGSAAEIMRTAGRMLPHSNPSSSKSDLE